MRRKSNVEISAGFIHNQDPPRGKGRVGGTGTEHKRAYVRCSQSTITIFLATRGLAPMKFQKAQSHVRNPIEIPRREAKKATKIEAEKQTVRLVVDKLEVNPLVQLCTSFMPVPPLRGCLLTVASVQYFRRTVLGFCTVRTAEG